MQVRQVAGVGLVSATSLVSDCDDGASILASICYCSDVALGFFLKQHLDRVFGVNTT